MLTVTLQLLVLLNFGELAVILCIRNIILSLQYVLLFYLFNVCCFCVDLILYLFISHVQRKLDIIEQTQNMHLGMISDVNLRKATFLLDNRTLL